MTRGEALSWLFGLQRFGVKLGLENIRALLAGLGSPERTAPTLLVTGSNGKGSVVAMASAALHAAGFTVGTYTSPHLVRFEERIAVGGAPLARRRTALLATRLRRRIEELLASGALARHPTFFEVATAMAFLEFAARRVDVQVIEVGLGGRFDATNASDPAVSVVTTVALEHTRWLGNTLAAIAFEKAGVARAGRPLVTGLTRGPALATLRQRARALGAHLVVAPRVARVAVKATRARHLDLALATARGPYPRIRLPLAGLHQRHNVAVAVAALEALPPAVRPSPRAIAIGLSSTRWPGRLEWVVERPALLFDGAHNPQAARALASYLRQLATHRPRVLLLACLGDKDLGGIVRALFPLFDAIVACPVANPRSLTSADIRAAAPRHTTIIEAPDSRRGLAAARARAGASGLVVVTGSLYLVGEVKAIRAGVAPPDQG